MNSKNKVTNQEKNKKKNKKKRNPFRYFLYDFIKVTGAITAAIWLRPKRLFENKKAKKHVHGGAVVIANHTNFIDPVALAFAFWYRRIHMLAMHEFFENKHWNWFFRQMQCICVNREKYTMESFRESVEVLEEGGVLGIFPEGGINVDKANIKAFKSGAVMMALKGNAPIVPVYIVPPKKWYNRLVLVIGEPVNPAEICGGAPNIRIIEEISQNLREKEIELREIYNRWKTKKS